MLFPSVRRPAVAGMFYPSSPEELRREVRRYIDGAARDEEIRGRVIGLIAPHAGYVYSGAVAGYAYKQVEGGRYGTVVVVGPSHRYPVAGYAIWAEGEFETPLGRVAIDGETASALMRAEDRIKHLPQAHAYEHSVEVQLPFLQEAIGDFKLVPILMSDYSEEACSSLAQALHAVLRDREDYLLVASTDLSHYPGYEEAVRADGVVIEAVSTFDPKEVRRRIAEHMKLGVPGLHTMMCGAGPVYVVMEACKLLGADRIKVLKYANSGDVLFGDKSQVVGYMAAAIWRERG